MFLYLCCRLARCARGAGAEKRSMRGKQPQRLIKINRFPVMVRIAFSRLYQLTEGKADVFIRHPELRDCFAIHKSILRKNHHSKESSIIQSEMKGRITPHTSLYGAGEGG